MIELIEPLQKKAFDDDPRDPDQHGSKYQRPPVAQMRILQQKERGEGAQHVLGAMREIDNVEHAKDDGEAKAEQRVERAVDQPNKQLPEQGLGADAEYFKHGVQPIALPSGDPIRAKISRVSRRHAPRLRGIQ